MTGEVLSWAEYEGGGYCIGPKKLYGEGCRVGWKQIVKGGGGP